MKFPFFLWPEIIWILYMYENLQRNIDDGMEKYKLHAVPLPSLTVAVNFPSKAETRRHGKEFRWHYGTKGSSQAEQATDHTVWGVRLDGAPLQKTKFLAVASARTSHPSLDRSIPPCDQRLQWWEKRCVNII
jgi:hypothetical protein